MKDKNGCRVAADDYVRLIQIDPIVLDGLPADEVFELHGMIGKIFKIIAITDKFIQIETYIEYTEEEFSVHELYLYNSEEFERVETI